MIYSRFRLIRAITQHSSDSMRCELSMKLLCFGSVCLSKRCNIFAILHFTIRLFLSLATQRFRLPNSHKGKYIPSFFSFLCFDLDSLLYYSCEQYFSDKLKNAVHDLISFLTFVILVSLSWFTPRIDRRLVWFTSWPVLDRKCMNSENESINGLEKVKANFECLTRGI